MIMIVFISHGCQLLLGTEAQAVVGKQIKGKQPKQIPTNIIKNRANAPHEVVFAGSYLGLAAYVKDIPVFPAAATSYCFRATSVVAGPQDDVCILVARERPPLHTLRRQHTKAHQIKLMCGLLASRPVGAKFECACGRLSGSP